MHSDYEGQITSLSQTAMVQRSLSVPFICLCGLDIFSQGLQSSRTLGSLDSSKTLKSIWRGVCVWGVPPFFTHSRTPAEHSNRLHRGVSAVTFGRVAEGVCVCVNCAQLSSGGNQRGTRLSEGERKS